MDQPSTELLAHLSQHPSWVALRERADEQIDVFVKNLAREIIRSTGGIPADELQYIRGFLAGMSFVLDTPEKVTRKLSRKEMKLGG